VPALYRALIGEITARNNNHEYFDTYEAFLMKKSLSRSRFSEILESLGISKEEASWPSAESRLNSENAPFRTVRLLKREWQDVLLDRFRRRDVPHITFLRRTREAADLFREEPTLMEALSKAAVETKKHLRPEWGYTDIYVQATVLVHIYES
jgi:hypothetical protein